MNSNVARKAELPSGDCRCISAILANTNGYRDTMTPQKTNPRSNYAAPHSTQALVHDTQ